MHDGLSSGGRPLDTVIRAQMESYFAHDFSRVRVHTDHRAVSSARALGAAAYTVGHNIVFGEEPYAPATPVGRRLLAHELTHVIQQRAWRPSDAGGLHLESPGSRYERAAEHVVSGFAASEDLSGSNSPAAQELAPVSLRSGHVADLLEPGAPAVMRLTPEQFRKDLGATAQQKAAIMALFADKTFLSLWNYLRDCPLRPKRDLGPLRLKVTPGLKINNVERYGGYSPVTRTLEINPTKPEHTANPAELADTITHELIHAVDDLATECEKAGARQAPLSGAATEVSPSRSGVTPAQEKKLMLEVGPGASNPCEEFIDINKAAQQMIIQILRNNIRVAKVGRPTITFVNEILRRDPKAMEAYVKCRAAACAKGTPDERGKAVAVCSADIIAKFMPADLKP